jgi:hypothetical protein
MKTLTPTEIAKVQATLAHARQGRATLAQLAEAHDLVDDACLNGCIGEIRGYMRAMVPAPPMRAEAKGFLIGIVSGVFTHFLLKFFDRDHEEI